MKFKKIALTAGLVSSFIFALWQLDLIRDLFIDHAIRLARENPGLSASEIFEKVLWETRFGFPPLSWFGIEFSLQTSFDLMYFLLFFVFLTTLLYPYSSLIKEKVKSLVKKNS